MSASRPTPGARRLSWPGLVVAIVGFVLGSQLVGLMIVPVEPSEPSYASVRGAVASEVVPDLIGIAFVIGLTVWLGWTQQVVHERLRIRAWTAVVPAAMLAGSFAFVDRSQLAQVEPALVGALVAGSLTTGLGEELMFRGVALTAMRARYAEPRAALVTAFVFGGSHLVNMIVAGAAAIFQAVVASALGYMLYLCRRLSGGLLLPVLVHAAWDFSTYSASTGTDTPQPGDGAFSLFLVTLGLVIVVVVGRRRIDVEEPVVVIDGTNRVDDTA